MLLTRSSLSALRLVGALHLPRPAVCRTCFLTRPRRGWLSTDRKIVEALTRSADRCGKLAPNKRLKLTGALVLEEAGGSWPGGPGLSSTSLAPAGGSPAA